MELLLSQKKIEACILIDDVGVKQISTFLTFPTMSIPTRGDFSSLPGMSAYEAEMLKDAYDAATVTESWDNFRTFSEQSFMFSRSPWLNNVQNAMKLLDQHSGSSYGFVMRVMEHIAKHGWDTYAREYIAARSPAAA
jgi:hypothetical protein